MGERKRFEWWGVGRRVDDGFTGRRCAMSSATVLGMDWPAVVGSGFVVTVLLLALVERLRRTFATRVEVDGLSEKLTALELRSDGLRAGNDVLRERVTGVETEQKHQWERMDEVGIRPLQRVLRKLEGLGEQQVAQAAALAELERRTRRRQAER